ncbi:hypothetical protein [Sphingomonas sp. UYP23]
MVRTEAGKGLETVMFTARRRRRDRVAVRPNRTVASFSAVAAFLLAMFAFAAVPSVWLLLITQKLGHQTGGALFLTRAGLISLYGLLALIYLGSLVMKGFGKALFQARYVHSAALGLLALVVTLGVVTLTVQANAAVSGLHAGPGNNNGEMLVAFAIWLLAVNNAASSIGNEIADRIAGWFEPRFAS